MLCKALQAHEFALEVNRIVKRAGWGGRRAHVLRDVASAVQVTKVDCPPFPGPHIISTLPARIEDRSS